MTTKQLIFPFRNKGQSDSINYFVNTCNQNAYELIMRWPDWPSVGLFFYAPSGAGKSHLGAIWQEKAQATVIDCATLSEETLETYIESPAPVLWENFVIENEAQGTLLFHLFNAIKNAKQSLLILSQRPAKNISYPSKDLASRMLSLPSVTVDLPDDQMMHVLFQKQFSDRQLKVDATVIAYLIHHTERSYAAIQQWCQQLDEAGLTNKRNITIPLIKELLS